MGNITYANKVALHTDSSVDNKYKCTAADMNMIKTVVNGKQDTLTAGTGIDITNNVISNTQTSAEWGNITGTLSDQTDLKNALDDKQDELVSGTNIKTINNASILGSGNITINADDEVAISTTQPTGDETIWIDPNESVNVYGSYISNEYGTSQAIGYSQEYTNTCNTYSTSEVDTGKVWTNGETIYRKAIDISTISANSDIDVDTGIAKSSISKLVSFEGTYFATGIGYIPFNFKSDVYTYINTASSSPNIQIRYHTNMAGTNGSVIIEYTKTS